MNPITVGFLVVCLAWAVGLTTGAIAASTHITTGGKVWRIIAIHAIGLIIMFVLAMLL